VSRHTQKRPWLAALLAFVQPGLGHVYLRAWVRALLWFGLWVVTVLFIAPIPEAGGGVVETLLRAMSAFGALSLEASLAIVSVTVFSTLDAYWLAARTNEYRDPESPRCPNCGHEVDADLEFCHWCTEPLEWDDRPVTHRTEESPIR
jgi:hypothetical protein